MSIDHEALAALLFFACEHMGQGDPTWAELVATGGNHETEARYRNAAFVVATHIDDGLREQRALHDALANDLRAERDEALAEVETLRNEADRAIAQAQSWSEDAFVLERERDEARAEADRLRVTLGKVAELADAWLARIPHHSGAFYPEASAYDDGKDTATDACADDLRAILAADPVSLADARTEGGE